jgi:hypothetical protein
MQLSDADVQELCALYEAEFGSAINEESARVLAEDIASLVAMMYGLDDDTDGMGGCQQKGPNP